MSGMCGFYNGRKQFAPHLNFKRKHQTDKFHICTGEMKAFPINFQVF